jgi:hypothetical protein
MHPSPDDKAGKYLVNEQSHHKLLPTYDAEG